MARLEVCLRLRRGRRADAQAPHKRFVDDTHRKRWHRQQGAKMRKDQPVADPVLEMYTCLFCGATFLAEDGQSAKWCKPVSTAAGLHV